MTASFFSLNATFAVELAVFAVVLVVLARFVIKPLQAAMRDRQSDIDDSMANARRIEELLAAAETDYDVTVTQARKEARTIVDAARRIADHTTREARQRSSRPTLAPETSDSDPKLPRHCV